MKESATHLHLIRKLGVQFTNLSILYYRNYSANIVFLREFPQINQKFFNKKDMKHKNPQDLYDYE